MVSSGTPELDTLIAYLHQSGLDLQGDPASGEFRVEPRGDGGPIARVDVAEDILRDYVDGLAEAHSGADARESARGLAMVHVIDRLTTDHGGGVNAVRRLSLVRDGRRIRFVEERAEMPGPDPLPPGGPYGWSAEPGW